MNLWFAGKYKANILLWWLMMIWVQMKHSTLPSSSWQQLKTILLFLNHLQQNNYWSCFTGLTFWPMMSFLLWWPAGLFYFIFFHFRKIELWQLQFLWCVFVFFVVFSGILLAATSIGPALGFITGACMQRFYVDFNILPKGEETFHSWA